MWCSGCGCIGRKEKKKIRGVVMNWRALVCFGCALLNCVLYCVHGNMVNLAACAVCFLGGVYCMD